MTNEEAERYLKCVIGDGSMEFVMQPIKTEVLKNAVCALEKRIPIRPIDGMSCPCGRTVVDRWGVHEFCPRCGQAIYWSDERKRMD